MDKNKIINQYNMGFLLGMHQILFLGDKDDSFTMSRTISSCQTFGCLRLNFYYSIWCYLQICQIRL